eukprot:scaffold88592_cov22-Tisochrysis_lutea.AAC.1
MPVKASWLVLAQELLHAWMSVAQVLTPLYQGTLHCTGTRALCSHHSLLHGLATLSIKSCGFRLGSGSSLAGLKHLTHLEAPWATSFTSAGMTSDHRKGKGYKAVPA